MATNDHMLSDNVVFPDKCILLTICRYITPIFAELCDRVKCPERWQVLSIMYIIAVSAELWTNMITDSGSVLSKELLCIYNTLPVSAVLSENDIF